MENSISERTAEYLSHFYEPKVTAYEFMKCFFACLGKIGTKEVDRDIISFLFEQKGKNPDKEIFEEIKFRSNGVNFYSDDVEDALFNLQIGGLLGKMNPSFGVIIIKYSKKDIDEAMHSISENYVEDIRSIAEEYAGKR
jgi:hypothetical protein